MRLGSTLLSRFVRSSSSHHRPWHIAMAVTVGVLLGILPKTSFLFVVAGIICVLIPAHLPLLALTAVLISFASPLLQSTLGRIGLWSLTHPNLSAFWMRLDSMPLVPWLGLHNTIINGSLLVWFAASVPVYMISRVASKVIFDAAILDDVAKILLPVDKTSHRTATQDAQEVRPLAGLREAGIMQREMEPPVVIWDDINHDRSYFVDLDTEDDKKTGMDAPSSEQVARRSAEMAAWAEELIIEELLMDDRNVSRSYEETQPVVERTKASDQVDDEERWLIETTMEMVRIAERAVVHQAAMKSKPSGETPDVTGPSSPNQESTEIQTVQSQNTAAEAGDAVILPESSIRREQMPHTDHRSHLGQARAGGVGATSGVVNRPREEALHYLLRHLKGVQEKAQKQ